MTQGDNGCHQLLDAAEQIHDCGDLIIVEQTSPPVGVALPAHPEFRHQFRY